MRCSRTSDSQTVDEQLVFEHQELRIEDVGARADLAQQPVSDGL